MKKISISDQGAGLFKNYLGTFKIINIKEALQHIA
jgi:hypothetical protein